MEMTLIIMGLVVWYLVGMYSFYYWWTKDHDLTTDELGLMFCVALAGVITWFLGRSIHGNNKSQTVFKKRE
tara:strand:+ start:362 stop:574 length:213 start_codon:yes stop_codon:yes gene_type:complete